MRTYNLYDTKLMWNTLKSYITTRIVLLHVIHVTFPWMFDALRLAHGTQTTNVYGYRYVYIAIINLTLA